MSIIQKIMRQTCVHWELLGVDEYGNPTYKTPVEIPCRWETQIGESVNTEGMEIPNCKGKCFTLIDIKLNSILMLGTLSDITDSTNLLENENAFEVIGFMSKPDIKQKKTLRIVYFG